MITYVDIETSSLDPDFGEVLEVAVVVGDYARSLILPHALANPDPESLRINRYYERGLDHRTGWASTLEMNWLERVLTGATLAGCNPAFDAAFLQRLYGRQLWHYRLLDVSAVASFVLGVEKPLGTKALYDNYTALAYDITEPDHTALSDALMARDLHRAALEEMNRLRGMACR